MASQTLTRRLTRTKPVDEIVREGEEGTLARSMGLLALVMFSVGSILGTGIFIVLGEAVPLAGPAVILSFLLAATACAFSALSYAELAGTIPVSGSSYSYTYATLGELVAWICGWCLLLEYGVSVSAVAVGWGQYLNEFFLDVFSWQMPDAISQPPGAGGVVNIPAIVVVLFAMVLLLRGISESARVNTVMVLVKIGILGFFVVVAFTSFHAGNFKPFFALGVGGVGAAASKVFFSYIGFDTASTAGEEAKNPKRDLPIAIIASLVIVTVIYVLVAVAAIGARPWQDVTGDAVLSVILRDVTGASWPAAVLALGAVISIASVVLAVIYGQTRILFAMSRDGLIPRYFAKVNPRTQTPVQNTLIVCGFIAVLAAFVPLTYLVDATSIGTLFAFCLVNLGVIVLRRTKPHLPRSFRTPLYPVTPLLGIGFCGYLLIRLPAVTWGVFALWTTAGLAAYLSYGMRRSALERARPLEPSRS